MTKKYACTVKSYHTGEVWYVVLELREFYAYVLTHNCDIIKAVPIKE